MPKQITIAMTDGAAIVNSCPARCIKMGANQRIKR